MSFCFLLLYASSSSWLIKDILWLMHRSSTYTCTKAALQTTLFSEVATCAAGSRMYMGGVAANIEVWGCPGRNSQTHLTFHMIISGGTLSCLIGFYEYPVDVFIHTRAYMYVRTKLTSRTTNGANMHPTLPIAVSSPTEDALICDIKHIFQWF